MKIFAEPEVQVLKFDIEDVITTSGGGIDGDGTVGGDGGIYD